MSLDQIGISSQTIKRIKETLAKFQKIEKVILYGSRAKGNFRNGSDIDLCLVGKELSTDILLALEDSLDELNLPYSFDLSVYHKIDNPNFIEHIDRVGIVFWELNQ